MINLTSTTHPNGLERSVCFRFDADADAISDVDSSFNHMVDREISRSPHELLRALAQDAERYGTRSSDDDWIYDGNDSSTGV